METRPTTNPSDGPVAGSAPGDYEYPSDEVIQCPFPFYEAVRQQCPVYPLSDGTTFLVSRYEDVLDAARRPGDFSSLRAVVGAGDADYEALAATGYEQPPTLTNNDPPSHTRFRKLINRAFTVKAVQRLEPDIRRITDELIDSFIADGRVELVSQFAKQVPAIVIADALGVATSDIATFQRWADDIQTLVTGFHTKEKGLECTQSLVDFQHYFAAETEKRRSDPRDDILTQLVTAQVDGERPLDLPEILELCRVFLVGGNETTASLISNLVKLLLDHPEQLAMVRADRSLIPAAIEEALRVESPAQWLGRTVHKDGVSVGGTDIPAGSRVLLSWASANRDDTAFVEPDTFDITRERASHHVAFGYANHYCIGVHLARAEVRIALECMLDRLQDLRPDPEHVEIRYNESPVLRIPKAMHLVFDPVV